MKQKIIIGSYFAIIAILLSVFAYHSCIHTDKPLKSDDIQLLYDKVHKDFEAYLLVGNAYVNSGNRDSAMYYGGKIGATNKTLQDIYNLIDKK